MDEFWNKFKKGAKEVGDRAAKLAKITALQTEIAALNTSKGGKFSEIGKKVYALYQEGKIPSETVELLMNVITPIKEVEDKIKEKDEEIERIRKELASEEKKEEVKPTEEKPEEAPQVKEEEKPIEEKPEEGEVSAEKPEEKEERGLQ